MPATSEKQRKFFYLVKGVQAGKVSPNKVGSKITKAAKNMSAQDVNDFTHGKNLPKKKLNEIIGILKELREDITGNSSDGKGPMEPMYLNTEDTNMGEEQNPIAKTFQQKGNFEQYVEKFSGLEIKQKEMEAIHNHTESKPIKMDKFSIRYESTDDFNNSTVTVIKKLREGSDLVFTVFQLNKTQVPQEPQKGESSGEDSITVNKSNSFKDEIEGGKILADLIQKLEI